MWESFFYKILKKPPALLETIEISVEKNMEILK